MIVAVEPVPFTRMPSRPMFSNVLPVTVRVALAPPDPLVSEPAPPLTVPPKLSIATPS